MKYTMETEDDREFTQHYNGPALCHSIHEFKKYLRFQWKYKDSYNQAWRAASLELDKILIDNGINMEDYNE